MMLVLSRETLLAPRRLTARQPPRPVLGRGALPIPRGTVLRAIFWRCLFEVSLLRYLAALVPFPFLIIAQPDMALPLAQAPLLMFALVYLIETSVLAIPSPEKRRKLVDPDAAARGLDLLRVRASAILTRIAAGRGLGKGSLHLVIEQSAMARVTPLTLVSVQTAEHAPFLDLSAEERALMAGLFDEGLDERTLLRINLAEDRFLRDVALEARGVSGHARLAAMAAKLSAKG